MARNVLSTNLANATAEICEALYSEGGVSKVTDFANKIGLNYMYCKPCENEMPVIETFHSTVCACCGSSIID